MATPAQGPWLKYQKQPEGPWTKYQSPSSPSPVAAAAQPTPAPSLLDMVRSGAEDFGKGIVKSAGNTLLGLGRLEQSIPGLKDLFPSDVNEALTPGSDYESSLKSKNTAQGVGRMIGDAAQFLIPGGAEDAAIQAGAKVAPKLLPLLKIAAPAVSSGLVNRTQGGSFAAGAAGGAAGAGIAEGLKSIAPAIAEKAIGVRSTDRGRGRTIGRAILDETTGIRPGTIAAQAGSKVNDLTKQVEAMADSSTNLASLAPARDVADSFMDTANRQNAPQAIKQLGDLTTQLREMRGTGAPIPENIPPRQLVDLKRGVGELKSSWKAGPPSDLADSGVGRVYNAMDSEIDRTVPGSAGLNQRISSLIPVAQRAGATDLNESLAAKAFSRFGARTGALIPALAGASAGAATHGGLGAVAGGLGGFLIPEILTSPEVLMGAARGASSPITPKLLRAATGMLATEAKDK